MTTGLLIPVNLRDATITILNEVLTIPSLTPYKARLLEVPSQTDGVKLRRIMSATKTGGGGSAMSSLGYYVGLTSKNMRVEITKAGAVGVAEYRWSDTGGSIWNGSDLVIPDSDPIPLELGIEVQFSDAGGAFVVGERWDFEAQYWTEVTTVPITTKTFLVNYANGAITFYSGDATIVIYASYEGRGSVVKAEDIEQIVDYLEALLGLNCYGEMYGSNINQIIAILAQDVYYQVGAGLNEGLNNGFSFQNSRELKCTVAGKYRVCWSMSLQATVTSTEIEGAVMLNSVAQTKGTAHAEVSIGGVNRPETIAGSLILNLAANDLVSLGVSNHTDTSSVNLQHASLTLHRVGS